MRSAAVAVFASLALLAAPAVGRAASLLPPNVDEPEGAAQLSNEEGVSRFAYPQFTTKIRSKPSTKGRTLGRLRYQTEDHVPEIYLALASKVVKKKMWIQIRVNKRPNGSKGWVPRGSLGRLHVVRTFLRINRTTLKATLYKKGKVIWTSPVGVGKASTPTPAGRFYVRERLKALGGAYGPWAFGTSAYSKLSDWPGGGVVGIHGTDEPGLIPGRPSHGCVRLPNPKVLTLKKLMPIGTPVQII